MALALCHSRPRLGFTVFQDSGRIILLEPDIRVPFRDLWLLIALGFYNRCINIYIIVCIYY